MFCIFEFDFRFCRLIKGILGISLEFRDRVRDSEDFLEMFMNVEFFCKGVWLVFFGEKI